MKKHRFLHIATIGIAILAVFILAACAPKISSADEGDSVSYPVGSLMVQHEVGVIDPAMDYKKKNCLSCHPRNAITAANVDYGGDKGVNPHAAHTEAYECVECHSVSGTSIMKCNACHDWRLPEGWEAAPDDTNAKQIR
jgi:hypothetical protein